MEELWSSLDLCPQEGTHRRKEIGWADRVSQATDWESQSGGPTWREQVPLACWRATGWTEILEKPGLCSWGAHLHWPAPKAGEREVCPRGCGVFHDHLPRCPGTCQQTLWLYSLHATVRHVLWGSRTQGKDLTKGSAWLWSRQHIGPLYGHGSPLPRYPPPMGQRSWYREWEKAHT